MCKCVHVSLHFVFFESIINLPSHRTNITLLLVLKLNLKLVILASFCVAINRSARAEDLGTPESIAGVEYAKNQVKMYCITFRELADPNNSVTDRLRSALLDVIEHPPRGLIERDMYTFGLILKKIAGEDREFTSIPLSLLELSSQLSKKMGVNLLRRFPDILQDTPRLSGLIERITALGKYSDRIMLRLASSPDNLLEFLLSNSPEEAGRVERFMVAAEALADTTDNLISTVGWDLTKYVFERAILEFRPSELEKFETYSTTNIPAAVIDLLRFINMDEMVLVDRAQDSVRVEHIPGCRHKYFEQLESIIEGFISLMTRQHLVYDEILNEDMLQLVGQIIAINEPAIKLFAPRIVRGPFEDPGVNPLLVQVYEQNGIINRMLYGILYIETEEDEGSPDLPCTTPSLLEAIQRLDIIPFQNEGRSLSLPSSFNGEFLYEGNSLLIPIVRKIVSHSVFRTTASKKCIARTLYELLEPVVTAEGNERILEALAGVYDPVFRPISYQYWLVLVEMAYDLYKFFGVNLFKNHSCLFAEDFVDPEWRKVIQQGAIFSHMHRVESQGHWLIEEILDQITKGSSPLTVESFLELANALEKTAKQIRWFWKSLYSIRALEYPLSSLWGNHHTHEIVVNVNRLPDYSWFWFFNLVEKPKILLGRNIEIPSQILSGPILSFLESPVGPEWDIVSEGFDLYRTAIRQTPVVGEILGNRIHVLRPHKLGNIVLTSHARISLISNEQRGQIIQIARLILHVYRTWENITLNEDTDENTILAFKHCCLVYQASLDHDSFYVHLFNPHSTLLIDLLIRALCDLSIAFLDRTPFPRQTCFMPDFDTVFNPLT